MLGGTNFGDESSVLGCNSKSGKHKHPPCTNFGMVTEALTRYLYFIHPLHSSVRMSIGFANTFFPSNSPSKIIPMKLKSLHFKSIVPAFAFLTMLFALVACNKTKDFENLDLLIGKDWHLQSRQVNGVEISDSCDFDDVLRFTDASNFTDDWGTNICASDSFVKTPACWKLIDDFSTIRVKYTFKPQEGLKARGNMVLYWEIIELSDTALIIKDGLAEGNDQEPEFRTYR